MSVESSAIRYPELVIGIAGPIGIDIDEISRTIEHSLDAVDYKTVTIRITDEIKGKRCCAVTLLMAA
jgi:hypothetical protein